MQFVCMHERVCEWESVCIRELCIWVSVCVSVWMHLLKQCAHCLKCQLTTISAAAAAILRYAQLCCCGCCCSCCCSYCSCCCCPFCIWQTFQTAIKCSYLCMYVCSLYLCILQAAQRLGKRDCDNGDGDWGRGRDCSWGSDCSRGIQGDIERRREGSFERGKNGEEVDRSSTSTSRVALTWMSALRI